MITVTDASIYSTNNEMAYSITYSNGVEVRAVEGGGLIRKEHKENGVWKLSGKPYIVKHNRKRQAERLKQTATEFLAK